MSYNSESPVLFESVSAVTATPSVELGTRVNVAGNDYLYIYNVGSSTAGVGYGVILSGCSAFSVTVSAVASQPGLALGVVKHAAIATGSYGWVLTRGFAKAYVADGAAIGDCLALALDGGFANASGLTGNANVVGKALSACASGTATGPVYFNF